MTHPRRLDRLAVALMLLPMFAIGYGCTHEWNGLVIGSVAVIMAGVALFVWNGR